MAARGVEWNETGAACVENNASRKCARCQRRDALDPLGARRKRVGKFGRHGDGVAIRAAHPRLHLFECAHQRLKPRTQRRGELHRIDNAVILDPRRLEVHAADVPTDDIHAGRAAPLPNSSISRISVGMEIIPVIDLKGGQVVHARMGQRDFYRPIETPLAPTSDPLDVTRGVLSVFPFRSLYVADLDAIERTGNNDAVLVRLRDAHPALELWLDNGVAEPEAARRFLDAALGRLVLGSEAQRDAALAASLKDDPGVVLSLDFRGDAFLGAPSLLAQPELWPARVIVMTLARVGSGAGPDIARLREIRARAPNAALYAAGGVRNAGDVAALKREGIAGALVASSLHAGELTRAELEAL